MSTIPSHVSRMNCAADLTPADIDRFMRNRIEAADGQCWIWKLYADRHGYGRFYYHRGGRKLSTGAHRVAYVLRYGSIPLGMVIDHRCRNRRCVNPAHLEAVTNPENIARGDVGEWQREKEVCAYGHPYSGDNLYIRTDREGRVGRGCRTCRREAARRSRRRRLATP